MTETVRQEIKDLHTFFERWFRGEAPNNAETFQRVRAVLDPGFALISPGGAMAAREPLLDRLRQAHGQFSGPNAALRIHVENFRCRAVEGGHWLAVYEEWHERGDEQRGRLSTALLRAEAAAPNGVVWVHVHETWLPEDAAPGSA